MSYLLPYLHSGWAVDQAILAEEECLIVIRFGHDWDETCMQEYRIRGFPTIKVFLPGKPPVDYQGARDAKAIVNFTSKQVFVVVVLAVFPLVPRSLSDRAYKLALMGTACSSPYSLYSSYRKPRVWNLQALQAWFQYVLQLLVDQVPSLDVKRVFLFTFLGLALVGPTLHFCWLQWGMA